MPTQAKIDAVAEIKASFERSDAIVLTEYRGLTVSQLKQLRRSLGDGTKYAVAKNKLTAIAAKEAGVDAFDGQLHGPTAIAFVQGDPVKAAKGLTDFAKTNPQLVIRSGFFEGKFFDEAKIKELAALESREFQLARVAGVLQAPMVAAARVVDSLRIKRLENDADAQQGQENAAESEDSAAEAVAGQKKPAGEEAGREENE